MNLRTWLRAMACVTALMFGSVAFGQAILVDGLTPGLWYGNGVPMGATVDDGGLGASTLTYQYTQTDPNDGTPHDHPNWVDMTATAPGINPTPFDSFNWNATDTNGAGGIGDNRIEPDVWVRIKATFALGGGTEYFSNVVQIGVDNRDPEFVNDTVFGLPAGTNNASAVPVIWDDGADYLQAIDWEAGPAESAGVFGATWVTNTTALTPPSTEPGRTPLTRFYIGQVESVDNAGNTFTDTDQTFDELIAEANTWSGGLRVLHFGANDPRAGAAAVVGSGFVTAKPSSTSFTVDTGATDWNPNDWYVIDFPQHIDFSAAVTANGGGEGPYYLHFAVVDLLENVERNISTILDSNGMTIDNTPPTVTVQQDAAQIDSTSALPIVFDVDFSEEVTGFAGAGITGAAFDARFKVSDSSGIDVSSISADIVDVTPGPDTGINYHVSISGISGCGTLELDVEAGAALDLATNPNTSSESNPLQVGPGLGLPLDNQVTYDQPHTFSFTGSAATGDENTTPNIVVQMAGPNGLLNADYTVDLRLDAATTAEVTDYDFINGAPPAGVAVIGPGHWRITFQATVDTIAGGVVTKTLPIRLEADAVLECGITDTVVLQLDSETGCGSRLSGMVAELDHTLSITDTDGANVGFVLANSGPYDEGIAAQAVNLQLVDAGVDGSPATSIEAPPGGLQVTVANNGGTATDPVAANDDYQLSNAGVVTFTNFSPTGFTITPDQDSILECDETVILDVTLQPPCIGDGAVQQHTVTISDDNESVTVVIDDANTSTSVTEGGAAGSIRVLATLNNATSSEIDVVGSLIDNGGSAIGADYSLGGGGAITFTMIGNGGGPFQQDIAVNQVNDLLFECSETIMVALDSVAAQGGCTGASITATDTDSITLNDNETASVAFAGPGTSAAAEAAGAVGVGLVLTLGPGPGVTLQDDLNVDVTRTGGTAISAPAAESDHADFGTQTVTFSAGAPTTNTGDGPVTITVTDDGFVECDETVVLGIGNASPSCATTAGASHTHTITDDETVTVRFVAPNTSNAGEAGGIHDVQAGLVMTATTAAPVLRRSIAATVTDVTPAAPGNAVAGSDYTAFATATITFISGDTNATTRGFDGGAVIAILQDNDIECDEPIYLDITAVSPCGSPAAGPLDLHTVMIIDDDSGQFRFAVVDPISPSATAAENSPTADTRLLRVQLVLPGITKLTENLLVDIVQVGGTATTGDDYTPIASGGTPITIQFDGTTGGGLDDGHIAHVEITITDDTFLECGDETAQFELQNVRLFAGGATCGVTIDAANDDTTLTIQDNETGTLTFQSGTSSLAEATTGHAVPVQLDISGGGTLQAGTVVTGDVVNTFAGTATIGGGNDYTYTSPSTVTFTGPLASGSTQSVTVNVLDDNLYECDESVGLQLQNFGCATAGAITGHTVTINDDEDVTVEFVAASSTVAEETAIAHNVVLRVNITGDAGANLQDPLVVTVVDDTTLAAFARPATQGADYVDFAGTYSFPATSVTGVTINVPVTITNDRLLECDEQLRLRVSALSTATCATTVGAPTPMIHDVTITDNETATLQFGTVTSPVPENAGAEDVPVVLSVVSPDPIATPLETAVDVTVDVVDGATEPDTAVIGNDFTATLPQTITFISGSGHGSTLNYSYIVVDDDNLECDESFDLLLQNPGPCTPRVSVPGANDTASLTINDNETATVGFATASSSIDEEGGGNNTTLGLVLMISSGAGVTEVPIQVSLTDLGTDTATSAVDYNALGGAPQYTILANTGHNTPINTGLTITAIPDAIFECAEDIDLEVTGAVSTCGSATVAPATDGTEDHEITINDNETIQVVLVANGDSDDESALADTDTDLGVNARLISGGGPNAATRIEGQVTVDVRDAAVGDASGAGVDYLFRGGTATFGSARPAPAVNIAGGILVAVTPTTPDATGSQVVRIIDDSVVECNEGFRLGLENAAPCDANIVVSSTLDYDIDSDDTLTVQFEIVEPGPGVAAEATANYQTGIRLTHTNATPDTGGVTISEDIDLTVAADAVMTPTTVPATPDDYTLASSIAIAVADVTGPNVVPSGGFRDYDRTLATIVDDLLLECQEDFGSIITLPTPPCDVTLGGNDEHDVSIMDNETAVVEITSMNQIVSEAVGSVTVQLAVVVNGGAAGAGLGTDVMAFVTHNSAANNAAEAADFTAPGGLTANFTAGGALTQDLTINITQDSTFDCQEILTFDLALNSATATCSSNAGTNAGLTNPADSVAFTINDDETVQLAFAFPTYETDPDNSGDDGESSPVNVQATVSVVDQSAGAGALDTDIRVDVTAAFAGGGTATGGAALPADYDNNSPTGIVQFSTTGTQTVETVTPFDDNLFEGCDGETVNLAFTAADVIDTDGPFTCTTASVVAPTTTQVTIEEDESAHIEFVETAHQDLESVQDVDDDYAGAGAIDPGIEYTLVITTSAGGGPVQLGAGITVTAQASLDALSTASNPADFTISANPQNLSFGGGALDGAVMSFDTIDVVTGDTDAEGNETIVLSITQDAGGCPGTVTNDTFTYTIIDDDTNLGIHVLDGSGRRELNWVDVAVVSGSAPLQSLTFSITYNPQDIRYNGEIRKGDRTTVGADLAAIEEIVDATTARLWVTVNKEPDAAEGSDNIAIGFPADGVVALISFRIQPGPASSLLPAATAIQLTVDDLNAAGAPGTPDTIVDGANATFGAEAFGTDGEPVTLIRRTNLQQVAPTSLLDTDVTLTSDYLSGDVAHLGKHVVLEAGNSVAPPGTTYTETETQLDYATAGVAWYRGLLYRNLDGLVPVLPQSILGEKKAASDGMIIARLNNLGAPDSASGEEGLYGYRYLRALHFGYGVSTYTVPNSHAENVNEAAQVVSLQGHLDNVIADVDAPTLATATIQPASLALASSASEIRIAVDEAFYFSGGGPVPNSTFNLLGGSVLVDYDPTGTPVDITSAVNMRFENGEIVITPNSLTTVAAIGGGTAFGVGWPGRILAGILGDDTFIRVTIDNTAFEDLLEQGMVGGPLVLDFELPAEELE